MRWNTRTKAERPEYPKLVPLVGTAQEVQDFLPTLLALDPLAELVDAGSRGAYARVHNEDAEIAARSRGESRSFPLA